VEWNSWQDVQVGRVSPRRTLYSAFEHAGPNRESGSNRCAGHRDLMQVHSLSVRASAVPKTGLVAAEIHTQLDTSDGVREFKM
jgi:hypothetical protein